MSIASPLGASAPEEVSAAGSTVEDEEISSDGMRDRSLHGGETAGSIRIPATPPALPEWSSSDGLVSPGTSGINLRLEELASRTSPSSPSVDKQETVLTEDDSESLAGPPSRIDSMEMQSDLTDIEKWDANVGPGGVVAPMESTGNMQPSAEPTDSESEQDTRIPANLRRYVRKGFHGGLVLTPFAVVGADPADPLLDDAYGLVVRHGLLAGKHETQTGDASCDEGADSRPPSRSCDSCDPEEKIVNVEEDEVCFPKLVEEFVSDLIADISLEPVEAQISGIAVADELDGIVSDPSSVAVDDCTSIPSKRESAPETSSSRLETKRQLRPPSLSLGQAEDSPFDQSDFPQFNWKESQSRKVILEFGGLVRDRRAAHARETETGAALARAAADAASNRVLADGNDGPPVSSSAHSLDIPTDPVLWIAQEEAAVAQALRAVRATIQRKSKKGGPGSNVVGGGSGSEELSLWSFLMPKSSSKLRPEAAAEMARAQMAAAKAVEAMREGSDDTGKSGDRADGRVLGGGPGRRPRSAPPPSLETRASSHSEGIDDDSTLTPNQGTETEDHTQDPAKTGLVDVQSGSGFPDRDASTLALDNRNFFARQRKSPLSHETLSSSPLKSPGFPRARSLGAPPASLARQTSKKKRVSFTSNTIHPI